MTKARRAAKPAAAMEREMQHNPDFHWPPDPASIDLRDGSWLTPDQAAHEARVSLRTVRRWLKDRSISIRVGGRVYIHRRRLLGAWSQPELF